MTGTAQAEQLEILVFSDDSSVRDEVIMGLGKHPIKGMPAFHYTEAATAEGVRMAIRDREKEGVAPFALLILDAEAKKLGGMGLAHELVTEMAERPAVLLLTARPQDAWLSAWAKAQAIVARPLDPFSLQEGVERALRSRQGSVVAAQ